MTTRQHCSSTADGCGHPLTDHLADARNHLRRAAASASRAPLAGADLYWALGILAQCTSAANDVIERIGVDAGQQLPDGSNANESDPTTTARDIALVSAVLSLATASARCGPVTAAVTDAQVAVTDLVATSNPRRQSAVVTPHEGRRV
ncbi:hypothetical protein [Rhodococcoides fascians]|uniref:hypothetical protein n=1 Tax=Rhodococcoides fascians TaxID=1828 RepID=UPI001D556322|nr:hypothetical protein [Rhodococcus fascians]CAH0155721.1 hypothetical protein SRABI91_00824 [Rhodococcus fascians]